MKFILMGLVKSFTKEMGRSPNIGELKLLRREADMIQQQDKIIPFPGGGKDKVSPFKIEEMRNYDYQPVRMEASMMKSADMDYSTPIQTGEITITAEVTASYNY